MLRENLSINVTPGGVPVTIHISQYDIGLRTFVFAPYTSHGTFTPDAAAAATLEGTKPDGNIIIHSCEYNSTTGEITYTVQEQLAAVSGKVWSKLTLRDTSGNAIGYAAIIWMVDMAGVEDGAIASDSDISALQQFIAEFGTINAYKAALDGALAAVGGPYVASTVSQMTDHSKVYVYTGSQTGYTAGHWYYWNGSAWTDGGVYQAAAVETDKTLTVADMAADAKATGDAVAELKNDLNPFYTETDLTSDFTQGAYYNLGGGVGATVPVSPSANVSYSYIVVPCSKGDKITVTARGGNNSRAWAITDKNRVILSVAAASATVTDLTLYAEQDGYFYINSNDNAERSAVYATPVTVDIYNKIEKNAEDIATIEPYVIRVTDNFIDFTIDKPKWKQGYPDGSQAYAITLDEKIYVGDETTIYGVIGSTNLGISIIIRSYDASDTQLQEYVLATANGGGNRQLTFPDGTAYFYISISTRSVSNPITVDDVANANVEMYCGYSEIKTINRYYPKYETAFYLIDKMENSENNDSVDRELFTAPTLQSLNAFVPNGTLYGLQSNEYVAVRTNENWQTESYISFDFPVSENDIVQSGVFERVGLGNTYNVIQFYDDTDTLINEVQVNRSNTPVRSNGSYISRSVLAPANAVKGVAIFYGISNATTAGEPSVVGQTYYVTNAFVYVGNLYINDEDHLPVSWLEAVEPINTAIGDKFCFGIETDTHYYIGSDKNIGYDLNQMSALIGCDFIANLGDIIQGYNSATLDSPERTRQSYTDIVKRYTHNVSCPVMFAVGNHDSNYLYDGGSAEFTNAEVFERLIKKGLRTMPTASHSAGKSYYYMDFDAVRVIVLNTGDGATANSFIVSQEQINWFTNDALDTDKAVLVLSHVPLVDEFSTNYGASYASIVSALVAFKSNGGTVIACISGHTHAQASAVSNGILFIVCTRSAPNNGTAEFFMVDLQNKTIATYGLGEASSRNWTFS